MDEIKDATLELRRVLAEIRDEVRAGFADVCREIRHTAPELSDKETVAYGWKAMYEALRHIAISEYDADPTILHIEIDRRLAAMKEPK